MAGTQEMLICFAVLLLASAAAAQDLPSPDLLISPDFFISSHAQMLASFKIFLYPHISGYEDSHLRLLPMEKDLQQPFFHNLLSSPFITEDPDAAHLFFIPVSLDAMAAQKSQSLGRNLRNLVQILRDEHPFWQRTLGADHFITTCRRFPSDGSRNVLELQKNSIWLTCPDLFGMKLDGNAFQSSDDEGIDSQFFPHKDITMPPFTSPLSVHFDAIEGMKRPHLVYLMDYPSQASIKPWIGDPDFVFMSLNASDFLYNSKFCLTFASIGHNLSIVEAMRVGCVPIVVSGGYLHGLPFQDILDWKRFSVLVSIPQLHKLKAYLKAMPETKYRELQSAAVLASRHFQWYSPPKPYDAFHMLMHQLWLRRHVIRYTRRSTGKL